jgi:oligosaccharide repeat unit polymerase
VGFAAFLIIMLALNIWRSEGLTAIGKSDLSLKSSLSSVGTDLNTVRGYMRLWELYTWNHLQFEYGSTYLYVLLTPIPRAFWGTKPLTSFESRWNVSLFGQQLPAIDGTKGVWIFTAWGEGLAQFGVFGVFLNLFFYGYLLSWIRRKTQGRSLFVLLWFYYSVVATTLLRSSFTAMFFLTCLYFASAVLFYLLASHGSFLSGWKAGHSPERA